MHSLRHRTDLWPPGLLTCRGRSCRKSSDLHTLPLESEKQPEELRSSSGGPRWSYTTKKKWWMSFISFVGLPPSWGTQNTHVRFICVWACKASHASLCRCLPFVLRCFGFSLLLNVSVNVFSFVWTKHDFTETWAIWQTYTLHVPAATRVANEWEGCSWMILLYTSALPNSSSWLVRWY